jgi:hypothetical protein
MFDAGNWIDRLVSAGGRIQIDAQTMYPPPGDVLSPESQAIWAEIQSPAGPNKDNWQAVYDEVRRRAPIGPGWEIYPPT